MLLCWLWIQNINYVVNTYPRFQPCQLVYLRCFLKPKTGKRYRESQQTHTTLTSNDTFWASVFTCKRCGEVAMENTVCCYYLTSFYRRLYMRGVIWIHRKHDVSVLHEYRVKTCSFYICNASVTCVCFSNALRLGYSYSYQSSKTLVIFLYWCDDICLVAFLCPLNLLKW